MLNEAQNAEMRARVNAATPGEWSSAINMSRETFGVLADGGALVCETENMNDADFVAHAHEDIPALLDEVERLRKENEALRNGGHFDPIEAAKIAEVMNENIRLRTDLIAALAKLSGVHVSLDYADRQRGRAKSMADLAVSNGFALGQIAVKLEHEFEPCNENGGADEIH